MYAIRIPGEVSLRTNDAVRTYARLEYGTEDALWLLASAKRAAALGVSGRRTVKRLRTARLSRVFARRAVRTHAPVACKGNPRHAATERGSPA